MSVADIVRERDEARRQSRVYARALVDPYWEQAVIPREVVAKGMFRAHMRAVLLTRQLAAREDMEFALSLAEAARKAVVA